MLLLIIVSCGGVANATPQDKAAEGFRIDHQTYKADRKLWATTKANVSIDGNLVRVEETGAKNYGAVILSVELDLDKYPYLEIDIPRIDKEARWNLHVRDMQGNDFCLQNPTSSTGIFRYDLTSSPGWSGRRKAKLFLWVRGEGKSVYFRSIRLINISKTRKSAPPKTAKIPLKLKDTLSLVRTGEPVTTGIPFPQGVLLSRSNAQVVDADGKNVPCQFRELAKALPETPPWA